MSLSRPSDAGDDLLKIVLHGRRTFAPSLLMLLGSNCGVQKQLFVDIRHPGPAQKATEPLVALTVRPLTEGLLQL